MARNCIILGAGRSGTSMVAGTLAGAGYFMGEHLLPAREANPKGFFEDPEINGINEELLARVVPKRPWLIGKWFLQSRPLYGQRWLARVPLRTAIPSLPNIIRRIQRVTEKEPFCFKDPRFSYTLPIWRPFLTNTVFICVFRDPASTVSSIMKEYQTAEYLRSLSLTCEGALEVWTLMYRHILQIHRHEGEWLFLHFNQVLMTEGINRLESFVNAPVDRLFPDPLLQRSYSCNHVAREIWQIYEQLCSLACYKDGNELYNA